MSINQKAIIKVDGKDLTIKIGSGIEKYLQNPALWFSEALTGAATYGKKDFILAGGQLVQGAIKLDLWGEFLYQLDKARKVGRTKKKFYESRNGKINFNELFSYLDKSDTPDEEVFRAMKAIFFASEEDMSAQQDEIRAYQLIQIVKQMKSIDLLILMATYELYLKQKAGDINLNVRTTQGWQVKISEMIGFPIDMVVDSRIRYMGSQDATYPSLFSVNDFTPDHDMPNMGLNATAISLAEFISNGEKTMSFSK